MTKYALALYEMDGVYSYIPLAQDDKTLDEAIQIALKTIYSGDLNRDYDDLDFDIVEINTIHQFNTTDYQEYFDKQEAASKKRQKAQQDRLDKEQFERLKKKFDT